MGKAARRVAKLMKVKPQYRIRLFMAGVLPVAMYGAEHAPWDSKDVDELTRAAVRAAGVQTPGVPLAVAKACLRPQCQPEMAIA